MQNAERIVQNYIFLFLPIKKARKTHQSFRGEDEKSRTVPPEHLTHWYYIVRIEMYCGAHPSPLSAYNGFFGCKHFSKANDILARLGKEPIDWQIKNI